MTRTARATNIQPLITDRVNVTPEQAQGLVANPNVTIHNARVIRTGYHVHLTYRDRPLRLPRRPPIVVEGLGRYLRTMAVVFGIPAALFATGWLTWVLFGDQITAALKLAMTVTALILSALLVGSLLIHKTGRCPGLHCPRCNGH
jgi:hypothetical protein